MIRNRINYSDIKNRKDLLNAINDIDYLIADDIEKISIRYDNIKQQFNIVHITEMIVSKSQVYYNTILNLLNKFRDMYKSLRNREDNNQSEQKNCEYTETNL